MSASSSSAAALAEQELREFSYIVSHDLAQSIRHLSQFSALLLRDLNVAADDPRRRYVGHLEESAAKCHEMLEQLLTFSRVQQAEMMPAPLDANRLVDEAMLRLSGRMQGVDIAVATLGTPVGDRTLLSEAIFQLLDNAVKFRATDQACDVRVEARLDSQGWTIRVADNGIGVPVNQREYVFRMFSRLNPEGSYPGIGAGLAIARRVARRHGGELRFVDCASGTCIEMTLPQRGGCSTPREARHAE